MIGFHIPYIAWDYFILEFYEQVPFVFHFCLLKWASLSIAKAGLELSDSSDISASGSTVESIAGMDKQAWLHFYLQVIFYKPHIFISCFLVILALNGNCCLRLCTSLRQGYNPGLRKVRKGGSLTHRIGLVTEEDTEED